MYPNDLSAGQHSFELSPLVLYPGLVLKALWHLGI